MDTGRDLVIVEHAYVEVQLQALVGQVDAELLKAVELKLLEASNVQNAHGLAARLEVDLKNKTW